VIRRELESANRPDIIKNAYENDVRVHGKGVVLLYKLFAEHFEHQYYQATHQGFSRDKLSLQPGQASRAPS
jgi:hypothetical protein